MLKRLFSLYRSAPICGLVLTRILRRHSPAPDYGAADRQRDFQAVFDQTPEGPRVLAQIVARCRVADRSYVPGDSLETARREGQRDIGLWLIGILTADFADRPRSAEEHAPPPARAAF